MWHCVLMLVGLASGSVAWAASEITLVVDCPFCGPGQPFPHDCPRVTSSAAALSTAETLSSLVDTARKETRRLHAINGLSLPELGDIGTIAQLDAALTSLIAATEDEIARCERERTDYLRKSATADEESAHLGELTRQLSDEIAQSHAIIVETENETAAEIRAASAARDEIIQLQKSIGEIREEIRQVRNRLFPRLHQAALHGWIVPPSSYRPIPVPLPPKTQRGASAVRDASPAISPGSTRAGSGDIHPSPLPLAVVPLGARSRSDAQAKLEQLPGLWERARTAAVRRDEAIRSLEHRRSETDAQSARLSALQPQRTAVVSQLANVKRNLAIARQNHAEYSVRLSATRATAVHAWIEWGIFQLLEKKTVPLLAAFESRSAEAAFLEAWRDLATTAVQLGSDPLGVITRFPAAAAARGETLDELQQDLARVREKFGLGFVAATSGLPPTALPYLTKEAP
jgi:hypothetical protein